MTRLTVLNGMAGTDFGTALDRIAGWGLCDVDLKDPVFGKELLQLDDGEVRLAARMLSDRGLSAYCLSSTLFHHAVEHGVRPFERDAHALERLLELADVLRPALVRILAPQLADRAQVEDSVSHLRCRHPWVIPFLGRAVERIHRAGFTATIENERGLCALGRPEEVLALFDVLDQPEGFVFTWDVQNMWEAGTFPSVAAYEALRPIVGYYHVKGGRRDRESGGLRWRSSLEDASWPVARITRLVVGDGRCSVVCLNPPHGEPWPEDDGSDLTERDLAYLRTLVSGAGQEAALDY